SPGRERGPVAVTHAHPDTLAAGRAHDAPHLSRPGVVESALAERVRDATFPAWARQLSTAAQSNHEPQTTDHHQ
ncbi:hypothetical protein, partial [Methylobacterium soli]|uniref:hypothetical protein n=1 Tax=Methylobacterium soli TaxID=553447 RepID=UPI001EE1558F